MSLTQATTSGRTPDRARMFTWLTSAHVVGGDGAVASWVNPQHAGFAYPEAAGVWLAWAAWRGRRGDVSPEVAQIRLVAARLEGELAAGIGVGKAGHSYLFDTCVALYGLAQCAQKSATVHAGSAGIAGALDAIADFLERGVVTQPAPADAGRWSSQWGPYLRRAAGLLDRAGRSLGAPRAIELAARLAARPELAGSAKGCDYVHAWCYALEGAALAGDLDALEAAAPQLARLQRPDGALPAWSQGGAPARADATAQAIRLWRAAQGAEQAATARALDWLSCQQAAGGGLRYEADSEDVTTWATCFGDQATAWAGAGMDDWI